MKFMIKTIYICMSNTKALYAFNISPLIVHFNNFERGLQVRVHNGRKINGHILHFCISANCSDFLRKLKSIFTPEKLFEINLPLKSTNKD